MEQTMPYADTRLVSEIDTNCRTNLLAILTTHAAHATQESLITMISELDTPFFDRLQYDLDELARELLPPPDTTEQDDINQRICDLKGN